MAQRTIQRTRRAAGQKYSWWKGVLAAVGVTAAAVILFALILGLTDFGDGVIRIVNQVIKIVSFFAGVYLCVPRGDDRGIRRGRWWGWFIWAWGC